MAPQQNLNFLPLPQGQGAYRSMVDFFTGDASGGPDAKGRDSGASQSGIVHDIPPSDESLIGDFARRR